MLTNVVLFTAFPMNLHAFSIFFCMDASAMYAEHRNQGGLYQTEDPPEFSVLQSDHSILCNTAAHTVATAVCRGAWARVSLGHFSIRPSEIRNVLRPARSLPRTVLENRSPPQVGVVIVLCLMVGMPCAFIRSIRSRPGPLRALKRPSMVP